MGVVVAFAGEGGGGGRPFNPQNSLRNDVIQIGGVRLANDLRLGFEAHVLCRLAWTHVAVNDFCSPHRKLFFTFDMILVAIISAY